MKAPRWLTATRRLRVPLLSPRGTWSCSLSASISLRAEDLTTAAPSRSVAALPGRYSEPASSAASAGQRAQRQSWGNAECARIQQKLDRAREILRALEE